MESRREELKRRAEAAPKMSSGQRRYDAEFKRDVTEYGRERQREGATLTEIAETLGLSVGLFMRWMRWAKLQRDAGKIPFEPSRRRTGKARVNPQRNERPTQAGRGQTREAEPRPSGARKDPDVGREAVRRAGGKE